MIGAGNSAAGQILPAMGRDLSAIEDSALKGLVGAFPRRLRSSISGSNPTWCESAREVTHRQKRILWIACRQPPALL